MARSETSIANRAIDIIGGLTITSLNDNTKAARVLKRAYTPVLNSLMSKQNWSFAIHRDELDVSTEEPLYDYDTAFDVPTDFIRLIEIFPRYLKHVVEGRLIFANATSLKCRYVRLITDPNLYTDEFAELLAKALAADTCLKITQSRSLTADLKKEFIDYFRWAASNDSKGSGTPHIQQDDVWMQSRGYGDDPSQNALVSDNFDYGSVS